PSAFAGFEMRRMRLLKIFSGVSIIGAAFWASGCGTLYRDCVEANDADSRRICESSLPAGTGGGGGGGGTPVGCIPSDNAQPVDDNCGVFVSSSKGADGAAGTKSAPLKSLAEAITKASRGRVYACAEAFAGSVTLVSGITIYGGLDCTKDWAYVGAT